MKDEDTQTAKIVAIYCDDCITIKHWMVAQPYINVRLCTKHASVDALAALNKQLLDAAREAFAYVETSWKLPRK